MGQLPTAEEQLALQLINRARSNPELEMQMLFNSGDSDIDSAVDYFETSESVAISQVAGLEAVAPLAWNPYLAQSADTHNDLMILYGEQSHDLPGEPSVGDRIIEAGYNPSYAGESVYAYSESVLYGHAGFYIDWGNGPDGIQDPAGHRDAMLSDTFTEVGIAYEAYSGQGLGPFVTTQHFGRPLLPIGVDPAPIIVGVAISDADDDLFYDIGEGLGGVTVTAVGGGDTYETTTWDAGGYSLEVSENTSYEVTFSGGGLAEDLTYFVYVGTRNVARDAIAALSMTSPTETNVPTEGDDTITGTDGDDVIDLLAGNDVVFAFDGDDTLQGQAGDDVLSGDAGNDQLFGGVGDDRLYAGSGEDELDGGDGLDWAVFDASVYDFSFGGDIDNLTVYQDVGGLTEVNLVVDVEFFEFNDATLSASQIEEILDETPQALSSSSDLMNVVAGTSGSDALTGTNEVDEISSGPGQFDEIYGFGGADTFIFGDEAENGTIERDVIYDFFSGFDQIDLGAAKVSEILQTSQGVVVILEGDGDAIYLMDFALDLVDAETILAAYL